MQHLIDQLNFLQRDGKIGTAIMVLTMHHNLNASAEENLGHVKYEKPKNK